MTSFICDVIRAPERFLAPGPTRSLGRPASEAEDELVYLGEVVGLPMPMKMLVCGHFGRSNLHGSVLN